MQRHQHQSYHVITQYNVQRSRRSSSYVGSHDFGDEDEDNLNDDYGGDEYVMILTVAFESKLLSPMIRPVLLLMMLMIN